MALRDRLHATEARPTEASARRDDAYEKIKYDLHTRLVERLDLTALGKLDPQTLRAQLGVAISALLAGDTLPLNRQERDAISQELIDEIVGLGPLEPLLADATVSDILVNTAAVVYVERSGRIERTAVRFRDNEHLLQTINRIVNRIGRRVDETSPMVDARLPAGSRVNAIIPPLAVDGPILSIRRFAAQPLSVADLINLGTLTRPMADFLQACVTARLNVLISGGTGSGKTTLLNALSAWVPETERIITIEDAAELRLQQPHVVRLETRPPNIEGKGEVVARDLVRNSLRMRPDRIIVGEVRSVEILDMLQAMNTGHQGSMCTIHANSPRDAFTRINSMIGMSGVPMSESNMVLMSARAIDVVVQLSRGSDGRRRVVAVTEVTGAEGIVLQLQEIFTFNQAGMDSAGNVVGRYEPTGVRPRAADRIERAGCPLPPELFGGVSE